eukprot:COSAG03_NODE_344_length_8812_cov_3.890049_2_plen_36_part_00
MLLLLAVLGASRLAPHSALGYPCVCGAVALSFCRL